MEVCRPTQSRQSHFVDCSEDNQPPLLCQESVDYFGAGSVGWDFAALLRGDAGHASPQLLYSQWLRLFPSPYLANPDLRSKIDLLIRFAHCEGVPEDEILAVHHASPSRFSMDERLARVRTFLLFQRAEAANEALQQQGARCWAVSAISDDFASFARTVITALKKGGAVPIQEVSEIIDEIGFPLSGEYRAGVVRISLSATDGFLGDWLAYVTFHELKHWYNMQAPVSRGYEEEELEAAYVAVKALIVLKEGEPIQWPGKQKERNLLKIEKIEEALATQPKERRLPLQIVWARIKDFAVTQFGKPYMQRIYDAAWYELTQGTVPAEMLQEIRQILYARRKAVQMILEMEKLIAGTSPSPAPGELKGVVQLALANQIPLAVHQLDQSLLRYTRVNGSTAIGLLGTP